MTKNILISDDELSGKSRSETTAFKKILSKQDIDVRIHYGRKSEKLKRRASFAGTGNDLKVLYDLTGNRRIIPIEVLAIDHSAYNSIDKTDILIEAHQLLLKGYNYRLTGKDIQALNESTTEFEYTEVEVEVCQEYLLPATEDRIEFLTASGIKNLIESNTKHRISPVKLGKALRFVGFERVKGKLNGSWVWGYRIHPDSRIIQMENNKAQHESNWN